MGAASYRRGSQAISRQIDDEIRSSGVEHRLEREAVKDERTRLLRRIKDLEERLKRSERSRSLLRATLTQERRVRMEEREQAERAYQLAVRWLSHGKSGERDGSRRDDRGQFRLVIQHRHPSDSFGTGRTKYEYVYKTSLSTAKKAWQEFRRSGRSNAAWVERRRGDHWHVIAEDWDY